MTTSEQHGNEAKMEVQIHPFDESIETLYFHASLCYTSLNTPFTVLQNLYPLSF